MKIVVLLKEAPDTETKIKLTSDNKAIDTTGFKYIVNPYDENAVEEALAIQAKNAGTEVVAITFGNEAAKERLIKALAMGADRGLLIKNDQLTEVDSLTISKILAAAVKAENPQLVLCGKQGIDDDNMHVVPMVAELLDWPHVNVVTKIETDGKSAKVERAVEGGQVEVYQVALPAIFGADKSLNSPRYASLPGIMKAKKKPLDVKAPADFGLDAAQLKSGSKVEANAYEYPAQKPPGKIFKGEDVKVMVEKVARLLREEAKVI